MRRIKTWLLAAGLLAAPLAQAELEVGMVAPASGGAAPLGMGMQQGVEAYFAKLNAEGGINGQTLSLTTFDDQYSPLQAAKYTRELVGNDSLLAAIGNVGTPTAAVTIPIYNQEKTLLFGAFTGAGILRRSPPDRYVINYRASYVQETAAMIDGLLEAGIEPDEIAFFTQNDSFGDAGYNGAIRALNAQGISNTEQLVHGRFSRGTRNVHQGLASILQAPVTPRAVIIVGTFGPAADFIREARQDLPDALFLNVSFVGSQALLDTLGPQAEGVIVTQVVPPLDADLPAVEEYRQAMAEYAPNATLDFISLEGYLAAKLFAEGVEAAGSDPDREAVVDGLLSLGSLDIGVGEPLTLGPNDHQASDAVWPTIIRNGRFEPVDWSRIAQ
ncbi:MULTISPECIES: ABC transporter substrate-binding protein [Halomonadaceae]|jgi:ABC-type branched-subunit amino acid transport system substrate-binding protein|uniref:ABC transporter substrate-binding protein n=1 Tax=Halomonadaceae TaxID=28256 RepID=UPI0007829677|nr:MULTISPECIES: ABC transporter substrate-binding protein [Halomonas]MCC4287668.1 ABC transporter substrate-binding protein [Halomonas meridiana]MCP1303112.1 ABC transporter substrate-binding protein [Halomonas sp. R1t8]MCP1329334.1 ABC transporter substrate-binding protein [Halomonas sp. R1t4]HBQ06400.1 ligand-binding receptor [Halomonas sp.]|tara:strand:+ start:106 stop:1263 length:1158 start_codon:yes stop_codon:yes gene_type:complete